MWFAVTGDLRFLSHHDLMRLMARAVARAGLPVKSTEGFNPRPKLSLALPKPVGVASTTELLIAEFDPPVDGERLAATLNDQFPSGARVVRCRPLGPGKPPQVQSADYELALTNEDAEAVAARLDELGRMDRWVLTRRTKARRGPKTVEKNVDIRSSVRDLRLEGRTLRFALANAPTGTARCGELLGLLGLANPAEALAGLTRTNLECEFQKRKTPVRKTES